jgi:hypothetical protein
MSSSKSDECIELKNLQYKSMLTGGNIICDNKTEVINDLNVLEKFLEDHKLHNQYDNWSKMDNVNKIQKLLDYTKLYIEKNELSEIEFEKLSRFFQICVQNKQLNRAKDVIYDKVTKKVKDVPALLYDKHMKTFTIKNSDKMRIHTLKSLPPIKIKGTLKNKSSVEESFIQV